MQTTIIDNLENLSLYQIKEHIISLTEALDEARATAEEWQTKYQLLSDNKTEHLRRIEDELGLEFLDDGTIVCDDEYSARKLEEFSTLYDCGYEELSAVADIVLKDSISYRLGVIVGKHIAYDYDSGKAEYPHKESALEDENRQLLEKLHQIQDIVGGVPEK